VRHGRCEDDQSLSGRGYNAKRDRNSCGMCGASARDCSAVQSTTGHRSLRAQWEIGTTYLVAVDGVVNCVMLQLRTTVTGTPLLAGGD
jgi:hypothetical protein